MHYVEQIFRLQLHPLIMECTNYFYYHMIIIFISIRSLFPSHEHSQADDYPFRLHNKLRMYCGCSWVRTMSEGQSPVSGIDAIVACGVSDIGSLAAAAKCCCEADSLGTSFRVQYQRTLSPTLQYSLQTYCHSEIHWKYCRHNRKLRLMTLINSFASTVISWCLRRIFIHLVTLVTERGSRASCGSAVVVVIVVASHCYCWCCCCCQEVYKDSECYIDSILSDLCETGQRAMRGRHAACASDQ